ncbi:thiamine-phosphate kinase [Planctomycetota bacterium]
MNEFEFIEWIRQNRVKDAHVSVGPGDDCAAVRMGGRDLVISIDTVAENIHFAEGTDPYRIGWKAAASSLSDIAACGCEPVGIVAACLIPQGRGGEYLHSLFKGLEDVCVLFGIGVTGGDMSRSINEMAVTVTSFGSLHEQGMITRSGARPSDRVFVTGSLGDSQSGSHLTFYPRIKEALRLRDICQLNSMIDISDGLFSELNHISKESGVGIEVDLSSVPLSASVKNRYKESTKEQYIHALCDGEDFELLFTVSSETARELEQKWDMDVPVTQIGLCTEPTGRVEIKPDSFEIDPASLKAYIHEL